MPIGPHCLAGRDEGNENFVGEWGAPKLGESGYPGFRSTILTVSKSNPSHQSLSFPNCKVGFLTPTCPED